VRSSFSPRAARARVCVWVGGWVCTCVCVRARACVRVETWTDRRGRPPAGEGGGGLLREEEAIFNPFFNASTDHRPTGPEWASDCAGKWDRKSSRFFTRLFFREKRPEDHGPAAHRSYLSAAHRPPQPATRYFAHRPLIPSIACAANRHRVRAMQKSHPPHPPPAISLISW
jgi:hypothetical protein